MIKKFKLAFRIVLRNNDSPHWLDAPSGHRELLGIGNMTTARRIFARKRVGRPFIIEVANYRMVRSKRFRIIKDDDSGYHRLVNKHWKLRLCKDQFNRIIKGKPTEIFIRTKIA